jgi:hypothetical protein
MTAVNSYDAAAFISAEAKQRIRKLQQIADDPLRGITEKA